MSKCYKPQQQCQPTYVGKQGKKQQFFLEFSPLNISYFPGSKYYRVFLMQNSFRHSLPFFWKIFFEWSWAKKKKIQISANAKIYSDLRIVGILTWIFFFDFFQNFTLKLWILPTAGNPYFATLFKEGEAPSTYSTYAEALTKSSKCQLLFKKEIYFGSKLNYHFPSDKFLEENFLS